MKNTLEKLRGKPKKDRQKIAFGSAFVLTLLVGLVWLSVVVSDVSSAPQTAQVEGPISALKSAISEAFNR